MSRLFALILLLASVAMADSNKLDRSKHMSEDGWVALPFFCGLAVGFFLLLLGWIVWAKVESFEICSMSREQREHEEMLKSTGVAVPVDAASTGL